MCLCVCVFVFAALDICLLQGGAGTADMIIEMRGKGRTAEGKEVTIKGKDNKDVKIFYRQVGEQVEGQAPVVCVHGVLDHSWSWREMQQLMAKDGVASYALDMPGCGYSSWPQPGFDYEWSEEGVKETLSRFVEAAGINGPITLMVQGFVYGQVALTSPTTQASKYPVSHVCSEPFILSLS